MKSAMKIMSFMVAFAACFACMPATGISQDKKMDDHKMMKDDHMMRDQTIVQIASHNDQLSTFVKAVKTVGLTNVLSGKGPYTVFAPTNEAFEALPKGMLKNLMKSENKKKLRKILRYHIVSGSVMASDLEDGESVMMVAGGHAMVSMKNHTMINDAKVIKADIEASNGVIHMVNKVLMPSSDEMMKDDKMKDDHMKDEDHMDHSR